MKEIQVYTDATKLANAAAQYFWQCSAEAIESRGRFNVVFSGGSTPKAMYQILGCIPWIEQIDWERTHIFWGDERDVNPDDPESNYGMAREALLLHVPIPDKNIHRIFSELGAHGAASSYERTLRLYFENEFPRFDLVFLGMGTDGHTASLFPLTDALQETTRWVIPNFLKQKNTWRITLTAPAINAARHIVFLVSGENKMERLRQVLQGPYQPELLPSQLIKPQHGTLIWMLDHPV
jgi:6-phosphogluconolactonase